MATGWPLGVTRGNGCVPDRFAIICSIEGVCCPRSVPPVTCKPFHPRAATRVFAFDESDEFSTENGDHDASSEDRSPPAHRFGYTSRQRGDPEWASARQDDPLAVADMKCVETECSDSAPAFFLSERSRRTVSY